MAIEPLPVRYRSDGSICCGITQVLNSKKNYVITFKVSVSIIKIVAD